MPFCTKCGTQVNDIARFCHRCGNQIQAAAPAVNAPAYNASTFQINYVAGQERKFNFFNGHITISPEMDAFNTYRKEFSKLAKMKAMDLQKEYCTRVKNLDSFFTVFPEIYRKHRKPLIDAAMDVFLQADIYDISPEQFEDQHTADFCLCSEDVDTLTESFNLTIEANQNAKIRMYNMMPGMVFSGLGGFAAALAVNAAVNTIAENDIKNADVNPSQRAELFARINLDTLMERAYIDYWRVFLSLTFILSQRSHSVWYPNETDNSRSSGLYQNLTLGRIPEEKIPAQTALLLSLNPYLEGHLDYLTNHFGSTPEIQAISEYFSV